MTAHTQPDFVNVAGYLPYMAELQPDSPAVIVQKNLSYDEISFGMLNELSDRIAANLILVGVARNVRTVLMVKPSFEFFALTFALFKIGAVPVLIDPGMGTKNLKDCIAQANPKAFIGITKANIARVLFGWARQSLEIKINVGPWFPGCKYSFANLIKKPVARISVQRFFGRRYRSNLVYQRQHRCAEGRGLYAWYFCQPGESAAASL